MSSTTSITTSSSNFRLIIDAALDSYKDQTGIDLTKTPSADKIQPSDSPDGVLKLFKEREKEFKDYRDRNRKFINFLKPAVQVIHALSGTLGEAISLVPFPPAKAIFVGIDVLLAAASGVGSSYDALEDLFECVQNFLQRLQIYTDISPTDTMTQILVKIMVKLLSVLALATKQVKQGRFKKFAKKLLGESEVESVLQRLDRLTQEEARMTVAQTLEVVHGLMSNMRVVMDDGKVSMNGIQRALVDMQETASKINKMERNQLQKDVRNWLSPPNPSTNHNIARKARQSGTAAWFFEGRIFSEWKEKGSLLWIHGKAGSGKSILLSAIIQNIADLRTAGLASMAYYYFDFRDAEKQHRCGLLASLLAQLSFQSNPCYEILSRLYATHDSGMQEPADDTLTTCLKDMLELSGQGATYIIIDGLDECPNISGMPTAREEVLELVEELVKLELPNVHICATSRPEIDIRTVLEPLTTLRVCLHNESGQKRDIVDYITEVVRSDRMMRRWREEDKQLVIDTLSEKADGMFRWVVCQLEILRRKLPASIQGALNELPKTLDETYRHALLSIDEENREYAQRLFQCLTVSIRPLRVAELAEVLAIRFEAGGLPEYNVNWRLRDAEEAVLSVGSSLISVVDADGSKVVQFSHFSVKEFLTSDRLATLGHDLSHYQILPGPAHTILAKACLSILLKLDDRIDKSTIENLPLAPYAARYWVDHAQVNDVSSRIQDLMELLFDADKHHFSAWIWLYDMDRHWVEPMSTVHPTRPGAVPLYYAALCGLHDLAKQLVLAHPSDVNARGGYRMSPLHAALATGYLKVAVLLLENNADVDARDKTGWTPLHRASRWGKLEIVRWILEHDADVNTQTNKQKTPLRLASGAGELEVVRLLLQRGAVVDCPDDGGATALHAASGNGHLDVVRLLLHSGAVIDARNAAEETPLGLASHRGRVEVSHFLIEQGADLNARDDENCVPLHFAARRGHVDVARLLLDRHVDVDVQEEDRWTPLHFASANGYLEMAKLFVQRGASVDMRNDKEETPLDLASGKGHLDVARFLIESGANVSSRCSEGWTPFHTASRNGHLHVAEFLLQSGVNVDVRNRNEETALDVVSGSGQLDVVRFLIEHGADVKVRDKTGWNPLHIASHNGHLDVALLLLDRGADTNIQKDNLWTPLHLASSNGHVKVAQLLVQRGANVNTCNDVQETALHRAAGNGDLQITRFLLDAGANLHAINSNGWTPLHTASFSGHLVIVNLLLRRGADIDSRNRDNKTAADLASDNNKTKVANFLAEYKGDEDVRNKIRSTTLDTTVRDPDEDTTDYGEQTTLLGAVEAGKLRIVEWFLERGADVNVRDADYRTPLDLATTEGNLEITQLLIEHDAEVDSRDNTGWTPLHNASRYGHLDIARLLIDRGADLDARMPDNWTPIHLSANYGHFEIVELLLSRGSNTHHRSEEGQTAFQLAARWGYRRITQLLMEHGAN